MLCLFFALSVFTKTNSSQGKPVSVDDRKLWIRGAFVLLLKGYNTCVLWAPSSSDLQILFSFFIDIWRTTVALLTNSGYGWVENALLHLLLFTVCMNEKTHFFPHSTHLHIELLQTFPLDFLVKIPLHCPTKSHGVQSRHFSIWLLICSVLLLSLFSLILFPLTFLLPFDTVSAVYCVSLFNFYFFPFLCFFSMRKGRCSTLGQLIIEAWRELAEIIAHVWLCRERTRFLLLWGFLGREIGTLPTVYSKRTAVLMQVQQGEVHLFSGMITNCVRCVSGLRN